MEKWRIDFPEVTDVDIAFGGYSKDWFKKVLTQPSHRKYENMASSLFFNGGTVPVNKNLPEEYKTRGLRILRAVIGSFEPSHEDKKYVCGVILESLCHDKKDDSNPAK
jgi:hypothetical protein